MAINKPGGLNLEVILLSEVASLEMGILFDEFLQFSLLF